MRLYRRHDRPLRHLPVPEHFYSEGLQPLLTAGKNTDFSCRKGAQAEEMSEIVESAAGKRAAVENHLRVGDE